MPDIETIPVTDFSSYLQRNRKEYGECVVISVTHCKNVKSTVVHEYLHLNILHPRTSMWRRLIVERQVKQDQVVIGYWDWSSVGLGGRGIIKNLFKGVGDLVQTFRDRGGPPLPLPMRNIRFKSPPKLQRVARVLLLAHNKRPEYTFYKDNCFWYAATVFDILSGAVSGGVESIRYEWARFQAIPLQLNVVFSGGASAARAFQTQLKNDPYRGEPEGNGSEDQDGVGDGEETPTESDASAVEKIEIKESEYTISVMKEVDLVSNLDEPAILNNTEERKVDIIAFSNAILADSQKEEKLAYFNRYVTNNKEVVQRDQEDSADDPEPFIAQLFNTAVNVGSVNAPTEDEEARYQEAIRVFAGSVLMDLHQDEDGV